MHALLLIPILASKPSLPQASVLQPFVDRHQMAGAVALVADRKRTLSTETVGYSNLETKKTMRPDSLFWIASISKAVTATALMILVDEGKVSVDDPVDKYLPEFRDAWLKGEADDQRRVLYRPKNKVLVRHLLTHTGGLPPFTKPEEVAFSAEGDATPNPRSVLPLDVAAKVYASLPLEFEPGTRWSYCNSGFNTLGRIVEVVSGLPYDRFLETRLFRPLGLRDTTFSPTKSQLARLATAYRPAVKGDGLVPTPVPILKAGHRNLPWPAGGLFSTARDLGRFGQMLLNEGTYEGKRILSAEAIRRMTANEMQLVPEEAMGLGWFVNRDGSYGHSGVFNTILTVDPGRDRVVVFLTQQLEFRGGGRPAYAALLHEVHQASRR